MSLNVQRAFVIKENMKNPPQETMQNEKLWLDILSQLTRIANSMEQLVVVLKNNNNMKREIEA